MNRQSGSLRSGSAALDGRLEAAADRFAAEWRDGRLPRIEDFLGEASADDREMLFLELMASHHRGGLHMAQEGAELASDDSVAALADRIARNQAGEINEYRMTAEARGLDVDIPPADVPPDLPPTDD